MAATKKSPEDVGMVKIAACGKKVAGVKKTSKETVDSGSVADRWRVAPTMAAVPMRGGDGRVLAMRTLNTYITLHPAPRIYKYNQ